MKNTTEIKSTLVAYKAGKITEAVAIANLQTMITAYAGTRSHPNLIIDGTVVAKYCTKHKQYEVAEFFPKNKRSKDGLYSHCRYAEKRAKSYAYKVQALKNDFFKKEDSKSQDKIKSEIDKIESIKNDYNFKTDADAEAHTKQAALIKQHKTAIEALA